MGAGYGAAGQALVEVKLLERLRDHDTDGYPPRTRPHPPARTRPPVLARATPRPPASTPPPSPAPSHLPHPPTPPTTPRMHPPARLKWFTIITLITLI